MKGLKNEELLDILKTIKSEPTVDKKEDFGAAKNVTYTVVLL
jgi:hypothetical protein